MQDSSPWKQKSAERGILLLHAQALVCTSKSPGRAYYGWAIGQSSIVVGKLYRFNRRFTIVVVV